MVDSPIAQAGSKLQQRLELQVIGVGASAGGLQPIEEFLTALPSDTGACCVIVQHLSPDFKSLMKELLERRTDMPVIKIEAEMTPQPNTVYLIPPGQNLVLNQGQFQLAVQDRGKSSSPAPHHPINIFFQSLADECGERAIGIVLSGTGTDGTRGLQAINEAGGLTLVQDPATAEFTGMPDSAINACIVDQILSPKGLAASITRLIDSPKLIAEMRSEASNSRDADSCLQAIVSTLAEREQVDFSHYKENTLSRRIHRRCVATGFSSLEDYIGHLNDSEEERQTLKSELLINVTYFFRNPEAWSILEQQVLPGLVNIMDAKNPLRIWCAACSTGEEAYSMAMMISDLAEQENRPVNVKIFATDLDQAVLDRASRGIYPSTIRDEIPEPLLRKYFTVEGDSFVIQRSLREMVIFANHNLVQDAGFTRLHLVSCRNVLIYMQPSLQEKVIRSLNFSLRPDGILFMGESENLGSLSGAFTTLDKRWKIYRKFRTTSLLNYSTMKRDSSTTSKLVPALNSTKSALDPILEEVLRSLVVRNSATCLVVDQHSNLLHVAGSRTDVLLMPEGRMSLKLQERIVPALRLPIVTAISRTKRTREQEAVSYRGIQLYQENGEPLRKVKISAWRPQGKLTCNDYSIVLIEEDSVETARTDSPTLPLPMFEADQEASQRFLDMEYELQQTRENLQATIEELEATNEEQQSTNEELVAANEELQSTNEELHSVNEELYTVNSEYQAKIQELLQLNADIDNLLSSTDIGVVFLDESLAVRRFTPAALNVFKLINSDVGRPIAHLQHRLELDNLEELLQEILASGEPQHLEIKLRPEDLSRGIDGVEVGNRASEEYLLIRLHPYRTTTRETNGIVISFVDISQLKATERQFRQAQAELESNNEVLEQRVEQRTQVLESFSNSLRQLHRISTTYYQSEAEMSQAYLEAGRTIFGLQTGSVICQSGDQLILKAAVTVGAQPELGQAFSHSPDFSWLTWAKSQTSIGLADMESFELDQHPLYAGEDIQAYLATQVTIEGELFGILEFVSYKPRSQPFEQQEIEILEMVAAGIANGMVRTRDRETLLERESRYRKLYNETPTMLHSIGADYKLVNVSDYWLQKLGYERSEVIGRPSIDFLSPQSQAYAERVVLPEFFKTGICSNIPYQFMCKNGETLDVLLSATAERDDNGKIINSLAVLVDVTEKRRLQQKLEQAQALADAKETADIANRAKSRFLASISHELRTPLNSILGFSELLGRDRSLHSEHKKEVATIQRAGRHLLSLVDSVLDLSKIEAEQIELSKTSFDLFRLLDQEIWGLFHYQAASKGLQFEVIREETAPTYICTDAVRLRQILINLVNNALKFTEQGSVILRVSSCSVDHPAAESSTRLISFAITDTGPGISSEALPQLFEAFTQVEETASQGGTGLGLNISYRLAKLLNGEITVESQPGVGSTFTLKIPVQLSASDQVFEQETLQDVQRLAPEQPAPVILIVEDNLDNQRFLRSLLSDAGFICHTVYDGNDVIQAWEKHHPDLIFMDIHLPNVDGITLIKRIKGQPQGQQTPIIAFTASSFRQQQKEILATGCDGYLKKPATASEIFNTIQRYLPVQYLYFDESEGRELEPAKFNHRPQLSVEQLQKLPEPWLLEFQHAIVTGSTLQMGKLIQQLPETLSSVAIVLENYVSEYRYQELLTLLTPVCQTIKIAPPPLSGEA